MSSPKQRIGLFGGTFDPIHFGHLNLALALREAHQLDEVVFCPTSTSPFKSLNPPKVSKKAREAMLKLALGAIPSFTMINTELEREGISYTIDTIKDVLSMRKGVELFLLLGEDALAHFHRWKDVEEIVHLAPPLTGSRMTELPANFEALSPFVAEMLQQGMTKIPVMEISSTVIRKRLAEKLYCGHFVPAPVLHYIEQHQLYRE
jgi:nicotinate-nucleotide adenylyltransferase